MDYTYDKMPAVSCCPTKYSLSWFGNARIGHHDMECCDDSVTNCRLGSDTKSPKNPFDKPSKDVGLVQQQCLGKSGAAGLDLGWEVLLPAMGFCMLCMVNLAL